MFDDGDGRGGSSSGRWLRTSEHEFLGLSTTKFTVDENRVKYKLHTNIILPQEGYKGIKQLMPVDWPLDRGSC